MMNPVQKGYRVGEYYPPSMMLTGYVFVDGGYFRAEGKEQGVDYPNPHTMVTRMALSCVRDIGGFSPTISSVFMRRMFFYDAVDPDAGAPDANVEKYWEAVEKLNDTEIRFGTIRGKPRRQKRVDILLSVDMLVGAFTKIFDVTVLIAGDEDFVPLVHEVKRHGITVVIAAVPRTVSTELRRAADRFVDLSDPSWWQENPIIII